MGAAPCLRCGTAVTEHVRSPVPREVPGFADAVAAGRTPARPTSPPTLRPGTTAHQALVQCGIVLAVAAAAVLATVLLVPTNGNQATVPGMALILTATIVGVAAIVMSVRRFRRMLLSELAAGYVTTTFHQGLFWLTNRPGPTVGNDVVGWVWDGVWVIDSSGNVVSSPDPNLDPPGMYPSPNRPDQLELWTGCQWIGVYSDR